MKTALVLALLAGSAVAAQGQTQITETRIGNTTFISGMVDGEPVSGTEIRVGSTTFTTERVGDRTRNTTELEVGSSTFIYSAQPDPYEDDE